jgi:hypothetical protein
MENNQTQIFYSEGNLKKYSYPQLEILMDQAVWTQYWEGC